MIRVALALGIVLETIEILRRIPRWLRVLLAMLVMYAIAFAVAYVWWIAGGLAGLALWRGSKAARQRF
jgi:thiamine transporter ThiT